VEAVLAVEQPGVFDLVFAMPAVRSRMAQVVQMLGGTAPRAHIAPPAGRTTRGPRTDLQPETVV
jgi:hypothetical protein